MKLLASGAACAGLAALLVAVPLGSGHALAATVTLSTGIVGTLDCAGAPPVVNTAARTATLASDCTIKGSVTVQDGYAFRGAGHTLTADYGDVEPRTGQTTEMFPAVLVNGGTANIENMTTKAVNTTGFNVLSPWDHSMEGFLYQISRSEGTLDVVHNVFDYVGANTEVSVYDLGAAGNSEVIILGNKSSGITPTDDPEPAILYVNPSSAGTKTYVGYNLYAVTTANVPGIASLLGPGAPDADTSGGAPPGVPGKKLPVSTKIPGSGISVVSDATTLHVSWPAVSPLYYVPVAGYCVFVDDLTRLCEPDPVAMDYRIPAAFAPGSTHTVRVWPFVGKNSQALYKSSNEFAVDWTRVVFTIPLPEPAIRLVKSVTPATYTTAGQVIHYTFLVINDGETTLAHVRVTDTLAGLSAISCPDSALPAGSSEACTATYRITAADLTAGQVTNYARAEATAETAGAVMSAVSTATIHAEPEVPVTG